VLVAGTAPVLTFELWAFTHVYRINRAASSKGLPGGRH
jgi:hypothetical protein